MVSGGSPVASASPHGFPATGGGRAGGPSTPHFAQSRPGMRPSQMPIPNAMLPPQFQGVPSQQQMMMMQQYAQMNQQQRATWPMSDTPAPVRPFQPIGRGQAKFTTFPSRMKCGVTTLMQPVPEGPDFAVYAPPAATSGRRSEAVAANTSRSTGRRAAAARLVYREESEHESEEESEEAESEGEGGEEKEEGEGKDPQEDSKEEPEEEKRNYLGLPPPGNKVMVQPAITTAHSYL